MKLFILFQGAGTSSKAWGEETHSDFLNKLKKIGYVYTYQDKVNNIWHYDKSEPDYNVYSSDIDYDLSYIKVPSHLKMVYDDVCYKYKNIDKYTVIPLGWSAGCLLALYFAQIYKICDHVILLESATWTGVNMINRLKEIDESGITYPVSNKKLEKMKDTLKSTNDIEDMYMINDVTHHIRSTFFQDKLSLELRVPTLAFINIQDGEEILNKARRIDIKALKQPNYTPIIMKNASHYIFDKNKYANQILDKIKSELED